MLHILVMKNISFLVPIMIEFFLYIKSIYAKQIHLEENNSTTNSDLTLHCVVLYLKYLYLSLLRLLPFVLGQQGDFQIIGIKLYSKKKTIASLILRFDIIHVQVR